MRPAELSLLGAPAASPGSFASDEYEYCFFDSSEGVSASGSPPLASALGSGSFGSAYLCRHRPTGALRAVKRIPRGPAHITDAVRREILNHRALRHPFVVTFDSAFLTRTHLCVAMEYVGGGDLFGYVQQHRSFNEPQARYFFQHLISGVEYLHAMRVVHRDLKLENLLVDLSLDAPRLKICDFGYSKSVGDGPQDSQPKTRIGTAAYISPEVYQGVQPYDGKASDVWACGVVLYVMLVGKYPFQDPEHPGSNHATMWRVLDVAYDPPPDASPECLDLLAAVFVKEPKQRLTVQGITAHGWFARDLSPEVPLGPTQPKNARREPPPGAQTVDAIEAILAEAATAERPTQSGGAEGPSSGGGATGEGGRGGGEDEEGARRGFGMEF